MVLHLYSCPLYFKIQKVTVSSSDLVFQDTKATASSSELVFQDTKGNSLKFRPKNRDGNELFELRSQHRQQQQRPRDNKQRRQQKPHHQQTTLCLYLWGDEDELPRCVLIGEVNDLLDRHVAAHSVHEHIELVHDPEKTDDLTNSTSES